MTSPGDAALPHKTGPSTGGQCETIPMYEASCSTMWGVRRFSHLEEFFLAAGRLGFSKFELNHQVSSAMLSGLRLDGYQFSSVHEPCPTAIPTEDLKIRDWMISSLDEECRRQGAEIIKPSIELASRLGARVVVLHAGNVRMDSSLENQMRSLFHAQRTQSQEYQKIKERLMTARARQVGPHLEAVKKSLLELLEYASRFGIRLGLENRYHYLDIPALDEMGVLLDLGDPGRIGFIYDVGHAQCLDRLGFYPHEEWLRRYSRFMVGAHLHDVIGITDHYAAGLGEVDFDMVTSYLHEDAFRTCELQPSNSAEQVKTSLAFLAKHGCIKSA